jgi:rhamnogalacturonyl hydrolase YesR
VNGELGRMSRDRCGLFLDDAGGYDVTVLYLWLPLLAKTAHLTGEARYFDEACRQYLGYRTWLEDPQTRLWFCAYGHGDHPRRRMPGLWALGNGYALAGAVSLLDFLPRCHARHVDVVCAVRRHVEALHEYLPVFGGWSQVLDNPGTFRCVAATALLTYGCAKAVFRGWVEPEYYAVVTGGIWHLGEMVDEDGAYRFSSLPTGGLDTLAAYEAHRVENDPGSLGFILSACAWGAFCEASGIDYDTKDKRLGAR